jgi:hypothetical protein
MFKTYFFEALTNSKSGRGGGPPPYRIFRRIISVLGH